MRTTRTTSRRQLAYTCILGTTQLHLRCPWVIVWWSAAFPGLGHLLLAKYFKGYVLFFLEVIVNNGAHVNMALLYTFTGRFEEAKNVLDPRWLLLYLPAYLFAIWDSYRIAVDLNHHYILASREDAEIKPFAIGSLGINYIDKRTPWVSALWSALMPGTGQLYIQRLTTSFFVLPWWIAIIYLSRMLPAIHCTLLGDSSGAARVPDPQWFLNIPSVYFFSIYDAYANTVENNKLFEWEQDRFFKKHYQKPGFTMPIPFKGKRGGKLFLISTFEHSKHIELVLTAIQMKGVAKDDILVVPLDKRNEKRRLIDTIHYADGLSLLDLPLIAATTLSIFGAIYGFVMPWGPIIWGLIGVAAGICLGLFIKLLTAGKYAAGRTKKGKSAEVVIIVRCDEGNLEMVRKEFWDNHALGVRKLDLKDRPHEETHI